VLSLQRSVLFSRFEVPSVTNAIKLSCLTVTGASNSTESMKIQNPYPKRNKVANFVRYVEQLHQSVNKIIERAAMTEADSHACFLHERCWVPIPVGILQLPHFSRGQSEVAVRPWTLFNRILSLHLQIHVLYQWL
jgi:hypothetical protein